MELVKMLAKSRYETVKGNDGKNTVKELAKEKADSIIQVNDEKAAAIFSVMVKSPSLKDFANSLLIASAYFSTPRKAYAYDMMVSEKIAGKTVEKTMSVKKEDVLARLASQSTWHEFFAPTAAVSTEDSAE
jgi:hypothetical protein